MNIYNSYGVKFTLQKRQKKSVASTPKGKCDDSFANDSGLRSIKVSGEMIHRLEFCLSV